jgi:hypothetical protein
MTCCTQGARAAFHVTRCRQLIVTLEQLLDLQAPLPTRRLSSREVTLLTSLMVARQELDEALKALNPKISTFHHTVRRCSNV